MKKTLKIIGIVLLVIIVLLVTLPFLFKDKIVEKVKEEVNKSLNAKVDFKDVDISIFRSFPDFSLSLDNLQVIGVDEFAKDTLTTIKSFKVTLDIMSVIKGEKMQIEEIILDQPNIHAIVLKNGKANWDIAKPSPEDTSKPAEPTNFKIGLRKFEITNGKVIYDDASTGTLAVIEGLNHTLKGDFTQDVFTMETNTEMANTNVSYGGVKYLSKVNTGIKADLEMDMVKSKYTFKQNEFRLNELVFVLDGWVAMPKGDIDMDLKFGAKQNDFKNFLSLVPGMYTKDFSNVKTSGKLAFDGSAKGIFNDKRMPAFNFNLQINNASFKYPDLPTAVNNILVDLKVSNPDGVLDHTLVNLAKMHLDLGKEPVDAHVVVKTPISDPDIDAWVKANINLANVSSMIPLEPNTKIAGLINADLTAKGRMSSLDQKKYEDFNAAGKVLVTDLIYTSPDVPAGTEIKKMDLTFNPQSARLNAFDAVAGKSDFHAVGALENVIGYVFKDQTIKGSLDFSSSFIDLNEFMKPDDAPAQKEQPKGEEQPAQAPEIPANIDFILTSKITKMLYQDIEINNMSGTITLRDQSVKMSNLKMDMLDGQMVMNGTYLGKEVKQPKVEFDMDIKSFDVQKTAKSFVTVKKMAPVVEKASGKYSTKIAFTGSLDEHMKPVMNTLNGAGNLKTENVVVQGYEPLNKVAEALKYDPIKTVSLNNVNISFKFENGRIAVAPFDLNVGPVKTKIGGTSGFDQSIDYTMNIEMPRSLLGGQANSLINKGVDIANSKGANFTAGEKINLNALIGGTVTKPTVKLDLKEGANKAVDELKDRAKEEINKKKKELEDKARNEADKAKKEAEDRINAEKQKAQAEADRLKREAEEKAKAESERLKKEAEEKAKKEAKDRLKGLFGK